MKLSDIGRYWAARELTRIEAMDHRALSIDAPISCTDFTIRVQTPVAAPPTLHAGPSVEPLRQVSSPELLAGGSFCRREDHMIACVNLPKGQSRLTV
jgi:hypothetical protein